MNVKTIEIYDIDIIKPAMTGLKPQERRGTFVANENIKNHQECILEDCQSIKITDVIPGKEGDYICYFEVLA